MRSVSPPRLQPLDEHNLRLISEVRPPDWRNPEGKERYHLVVIGAGTAGLVTAAIAAALGAKVALVERHLMGGDCLNVGCVPSKALIEAARAWSVSGGSADAFGGAPTAGDGDFGQVMERMRRIRSEIAHHDSASRFKELGVDVFFGHATFTGSDRLEVEGQTLRFQKAVIATGTHPSVPDLPGLADAGYLTNDTAFELVERPQSMAVIGGGAIGCELAQSFARFGTRVSLIEMLDRILAAEDPDASAVVLQALQRDGVEVLTGSRLKEVRVHEGHRVITVESAGEVRDLAVDEILVSAGRKPNLEGLGLEAAGVESDPRKGVLVDERMRTSNARIYAVGDIASPFKFTHSADAQARLVVRNALFFGRSKASDLVIPWCTYTSPEVAHVGVTAAQIVEGSVEAESVTVQFSEVDRAKLDGRTEGFLRVHLKPGTDTIIGATIVGHEAGELIPILTHALSSGTGLSALGGTIFPYPTRAEIIRKAADQWRRRKLTPTAKKALETFFRFRG